MSLQMKKTWFVNGEFVEQVIPESEIYKQEREWVGLDAEDLDEIDSDALLANCSGDHAAMAIVVAVMVEAKLKERNT